MKRDNENTLCPLQLMYSTDRTKVSNILIFEISLQFLFSIQLIKFKTFNKLEKTD